MLTDTSEYFGGQTNAPRDETPSHETSHQEREFSPEIDVTHAKEIEVPFPTKYLSAEFVQAAPIHDGVEALFEWLENNLEQEVRAQVKNRVQEWNIIDPTFLAYLQTSPLAKNIIEGMLQREITTIGRPLYSYMRRLNKLATFKSKDLATLPEWKRKHYKTLDELKFRTQELKGVLIQDLGLEEEAKALEYLFAQAQAIPVELVSPEQNATKPKRVIRKPRSLNPIPRGEQNTPPVIPTP